MAGDPEKFQQAIDKASLELQTGFNTARSKVTGLAETEYETSKDARAAYKKASSLANKAGVVGSLKNNDTSFERAQTQYLGDKGRLRTQIKQLEFEESLDGPGVDNSPVRNRAAAVGGAFTTESSFERGAVKVGGVKPLQPGK